MNDRKKALNKIYDLIKEHYGDCTSVNVFVNCEGIEVTAVEKPFTINETMRTINGKWLEKKEDWEMGLYDE